jgi:glutaredoxin
MLRLVRVTLAALLFGSWSCPRPAVEKKATTPDAEVKLSAKDGVGLLFSFFDQRAEMRTVERVGDVAPAARGEVMVTDPRRSLPGDLIYIADLRTREPSGRYRTWTEAKGAWLDRVMPKLSLLRTPVEALAKATPPPKKPKVRKKVRRKVAARAPAAAPRAILFSTSWCPSCRAARQYLASLNVPVLELDVEKDPRAAQQYQSLQAAHQLKPGVVPLIVINGRPMQGFSKAQIDAALAAGPG